MRRRPSGKGRTGAPFSVGWGESEHCYDRNDNHGLATTDLSGRLASLTLGCNHMISPGFLVGVEGDIGLLDLSADDKVIFDGHVWKAEFGPLWGSVRAPRGHVVRAKNPALRHWRLGYHRGE